MHCLLTTTIFLLSFLSQASAFGSSSSNRAPSKNAILLSNVQTLTLHSGRQTSNRRVSSIPQLRCVGPSKKICSLHTIEVMQCTNQGYDYDDEDVQWSCSASLPAEFKLGGTEVVCEGYRDPDDKWVLKGSCGVEYSMLLTDVGEEKFGRVEHDTTGGGFSFMAVLIFGVVCFILIKACTSPNRGAGGRAGWGGGGGGGDPPYDPPPPYDSRGSWGSGPSSSSGPGFWSGAAIGGAAGYGLGRRSSGNQSSNRDPWVGGSGSSGSSGRHQSTGFGSTRRR
ncbi:hypothetical protein FQN54_008575 [Arachnomyces sp. PD_36]|nr:hypothetical protein FQN54_008575 [Arachnomyces sp. PD_36]